jgi:hypothetical protein
LKNFVTFRRGITPVHSAKMRPKKKAMITRQMTKKMIMSKMSF